jgi:hypothetical protein
VPHQVNGDRGLGNLDAHLQQFAVNARRTPARVIALINRISSRISCGTLGRPGLPRYIFHLQNRREPFRCQATTVSALTSIRVDFHSAHTHRSQTQKIRSAAVSFSRLGAAEFLNSETTAPSTSITC